tara:strand:+ start:553 stop:909 length:357 start_codon:yes stop_codon:yes gene_type:complete
MPKTRKMNRHKKKRGGMEAAKDAATKLATTTQQSAEQLHAAAAKRLPGANAVEETPGTAPGTASEVVEEKAKKPANFFDRIKNLFSRGQGGGRRRKTKKGRRSKRTKKHGRRKRKGRR